MLPAKNPLGESVCCAPKADVQQCGVSSQKATMLMTRLSRQAAQALCVDAG